MQHLRAVADGTLAQSAAVAAVFAERRLRANRTDHRHSPAAEPRRPRQSSGAASAATAVLARSSGHCEVLAEGCRYTFDRLVSRLPTATRNETLTAPTAFAACGSCADSLAGLSPDLAAELGYLVGARRDPAQVPFYWRASRWVLFTRDGWLAEMSQHIGEVAV